MGADIHDNIAEPKLDLPQDVVVTTKLMQDDSSRNGTSDICYDQLDASDISKSADNL